MLDRDTMVAPRTGLPKLQLYEEEARDKEPDVPQVSMRVAIPGPGGSTKPPSDDNLITMI